MSTVPATPAADPTARAAIYGWADLLGGWAAAGGAPALVVALGPPAEAAARPLPEPLLRVLGPDGDGHTVELAALAGPDGWPRPYAEARGALAGAPPWALPATGAWLALLREEFARPAGGAELRLTPSAAPGGPAALAAAAVVALAGALALRLPPASLAWAARQAGALAAADPGPLAAAACLAATPGAATPIVGGAWAPLPPIALPGRARLTAAPAPAPADPAALAALAADGDAVADEALRARLAAALLRRADPADPGEALGLIAELMARSHAELERRGLAAPAPGGRLAADGATLITLEIAPERKVRRR